MNKAKKVILSAIILLSATPTIVFGSSITLSLISGKTPEEAIEILATQMDVIFDRLGIIEEKQIVQDITFQEQGQTIASTTLELASTSLAVEQNFSERQAKLSQQQAIIDEQVANLNRIKNDINAQLEKEKACREANDLLVQITRSCNNYSTSTNQCIAWQEYINKMKEYIAEAEVKIATNNFNPPNPGHNMIITTKKRLEENINIWKENITIYTEKIHFFQNLNEQYLKKNNECEK